MSCRNGLSHASNSLASDIDSYFKVDCNLDGGIGEWTLERANSYFALRMVPPMDEEPPYSSS
jgi:hypothetical protein